MNQIVIFSLSEKFSYFLGIKKFLSSYYIICFILLRKVKIIFMRGGRIGSSEKSSEVDKAALMDPSDRHAMSLGTWSGC